jgi:hypothetical protein
MKREVKKFKEGCIQIKWINNGTLESDSEFEFEILGRHLMTLQGEGIRDLMNCLVKLTDEFKKLAKEVKKK